jgi:endonuclease G
MKYVFLLIPFISFGQRDSVKIEGKIFRAVYSEKLQQPLIVLYDVNCSRGKASREGLDFYTVDSVKTSDDFDYKNNLYDKGHMAPAADFNCSMETLKQTFSYINCALQHQDLNRGMWEQLEEYERFLYRRYGTINVKIIVEFKKPLKKLKTGATVPSGFYKELYIVSRKQTMRFYMPNVKPTSNQLSTYQIKSK